MNFIASVSSNVFNRMGKYIFKVKNKSTIASSSKIGPIYAHPFLLFDTEYFCPYSKIEEIDMLLI